MINNGSFRCGIVMISLFSIFIMILILDERRKGRGEYKGYSPAIAILTIALFLIYSIFLISRLRVKIERFRIADRYIHAMSVINSEV